MLFTREYANPSVARVTDQGLQVCLSADTSRPPVSLKAKIKFPREHAWLMLVLHDVVASDLRRKVRDYSGYQSWVQDRYIEELDERQANLWKQYPNLEVRKKQILADLEHLEFDRNRQIAIIHSDSFCKARDRYFSYLHETDLDQWLVLDPVISVHPDVTLFEGFSLDESSYCRVTVPVDNLELEGEPRYGTTNIDFSEKLAREFQRLRSYRPAFLDVGAEQVTIKTSAGSAVEKKIDLPDSWVRGFMQVQSASGMPATTVFLSSETVANILTILRRRREREGPRSLRFKLQYGKKPTIEIEPWGIQIEEPRHAYDGASSGEVRIWGRRRLFPLERLLPFTETVDVRLLGSGMPSFWSVALRGHRLDLGLSGWTSNDWSKHAQFDLMAAKRPVEDSLLQEASRVLEQHLVLDSKELAQELAIPRETAAAALQTLCGQGEAVYDLARLAYRWRRLLKPELQQKAMQQSTVFQQAGALIRENRVRQVSPPEEQPRGTVRHHCEVTIRKTFHPVVELDDDNRVTFAQCNCGFFRRNKLRQGPCPHLSAAIVYLGQHQRSELSLVDRSTH